MPAAKPAVEVFLPGPLRSVGFLVLADGRSPAKDYLTNLRGTKRGAKRVAGITAKLQHLTTELTVGRHLKQWEGPILQMTCPPYRIMCCEEEIDGKRFLILLNVF